tara:strand:- start:699 stop:983 length:285 start_codon:yes stop_codon:yes gene_type:complete
MGTLAFPTTCSKKENRRQAQHGMGTLAFPTTCSVGFGAGLKHGAWRGMAAERRNTETAAEENGGETDKRRREEQRRRKDKRRETKNGRGGEKTA